MILIVGLGNPGKKNGALRYAPAFLPDKRIHL
jgi:peptidyl-tRNA hydrolase